MEIRDKASIRIKAPYTAALTTVKGLMILPLLLIAAGAGLQMAGSFSWNMVAYIMGGIAFGILFLSWLILLIRRNLIASRMKDFLGSNRVLVQWSYSSEEWKQMREDIWQEEKGDWRIQLGCLTVLFGVVGLLTGGMIGADEGGAEALIGALTGFLAGLAPGAVIGTVVSRINLLISRRAHADRIPAHVALGHQEILFNDEYFRGNGISRYLQNVRFGRGEQADELTFNIWWPQIRTDPEKEWTIPVPDHMRQQVESVLDRIAAPAGE
ncbi:MAG: hypothetical protein R2941_16990 [Desulfobacterales bacterium]